jgi:hypothetical protein
MSKERSFIELSALPLDALTTGMKLSLILEQTKYAVVSEADKREIIIIKEAFVLLDPKRQRVGVFTRSDQDHGTKIGECSTILCGNFDKRECTITKDRTIIYDVKDRLHSYVREISGLFVEVPKSTIPTIYYHDKERGKRYLFLLFELNCSSNEMPLCYRLDNRSEDLFIGMREIREVSRGVEKYNRSSFNVDKALVNILIPKRRLFPGKFSLAEKLVEAKLASFTLIKFNLLGL